MWKSALWRFLTRCYATPWLVLAMTMLMWAGNVVASRLAVGEISPMALTCLRWVIVCILLTPVTHRNLAADWNAVRPIWPRLFVLAILGLTGFNALFYAAGHITSGVNIAIIQGAIPIFVLIGNLVFFGVRASAMQLGGLVLTLLGIVVVATHGNPLALRDLQTNLGDLLILIAGVFYAAYTLDLRERPQTTALGFFTMLAYAACLTSLPLLAYEILGGTVIWPTPKGLLILLYVALCPSFLSQVFYLRGIQLIGPARAGLFINLLPVFGALLSVLLVGEPFGSYHALALALVVGGIFVAERMGKRRKIA
ncbi:MAG: DMT family transporter [Methylobacteriaceae bacterium]|nr:DMT family transporter [Methylobacteriaceae bacterium]